MVDLHRAEIHEIQTQAEVFGTFRLPIQSLYFVQNCHQLVDKQHVHPQAQTCRLAAVALHGLTPETGIVFQPLFRFRRVSCVVLFLADSATLRVMTAQRGATRGYSDDVTLVKATCAVPYCRYCGSRKSHQPPVHAWAVCVRVVYPLQELRK